MIDIAVNLKGVNLETEIKSCTNNPQHCRLIISYPNIIAKDKEYVDTVENVTHSLLKTILDSVIYPTVSKKIYEKIFKPVENCIFKL
jgi:hypothetical protein